MPLLRLPPEIHLIILRFVFFRDRIHLKQTCQYFNDLIPPLSHAELLAAETSDYAQDRDLYTCRYCLRLLPASMFAHKMLQSRRAKHGRDVDRRFCVECGLKPRDGTARYGPGAQITMQGTVYVICLLCKQFRRGALDGLGKQTSYCESCRPASGMTKST